MTTRLEYNATVANRLDLTDALSIFHIQPDTLPARRPWFAAGQYCVLGLNNTDEPQLGAVRRAMSIASPPEDDGPLEFYIRRVDRPRSKNPLTHLLWKATPGDRLFARSVAAGTFTIEHTVGAVDPRIRVLVAAGTGVAPFMSMIRSEVRRNGTADLTRWVLLHGASYPADLGYRDELLQLSARNGLRYWATLSRPGEAPDWKGDVGRVETFFEPSRLSDLEQRLGLRAGGFTPANIVVYVCGPMGTIGGTILHLIGQGFIPGLDELRQALSVPQHTNSSLFAEAYDAGHVIDITDSATVALLRARVAAAVAQR